MWRFLLTLAGLIILSLLLFSVAQDKNNDIAFPANYQDETEFTNYLSLDRVQNHDQIIRLFGNNVAMQGPNEDGKLGLKKRQLGICSL